MQVYTDEDVLALEPTEVVETMRAAVRAHHAAVLEAPPRVHTAVGDGRIVFTAGGIPGGAVGFRAYGVGFDGGDDQVVAVWQSGRLATLVVGEELGIRRTAGLGAVAADLLARHDAESLGLIGAGRQARAHVRELAAVRELRHVRVFSRSPQRRQEAATWIRSHLGIDADAAASAEAAAAHADLVTLATSSVEPVILPEAVAGGTHVTTLGPKFEGRHELPTAIADRAAVIAVDSRRQVGNYSSRFFLAGTDNMRRMTELSELLDQQPPPTDRSDVTLFCSVGLAGTEPLLATAVAAAAPGRLVEMPG